MAGPGQGRGSSGELLTGRVSVRFAPSDLRVISLIAASEGYRGPALFIRHATFERIERKGPPVVAGKPLLWSSADNDGAATRAAQLRRIGNNLNQYIRAMNTIAARLAGEADERAIEGMPIAADVDALMGEIRVVAAAERAWVDELNARFPRRRDGRRRGSRAAGAAGGPPR